ncbi:MAG TPA: uroporphyrinogen decarboxylase family protein [Chloroflexota bacterium]|nr:uroporphyrinogen decarboxylase family protein [Chloroflexota bacterium]
MASMSKRERVWAAVHGEGVDRPPFFFWHHFRPHNVPHALAQATIDFFGRFDLDIYKIMPDMPYPFPPNSIHGPDDWGLVAHLEPTASNLGRMVETTALVRRAVGPDVPIVVTVYSPITEARRFAGGPDALRGQLQANPDAVHRVLGVLAGNLAAYCRALLAAGADGIYYAVQGIAGGWLSEADFREFARPYDLQVLDACDAGWLNVAHLHGGPEQMLDLALGYPCAALSWEDRLTGVRLADLRQKLGARAAMGGIDERGPITRGDVAALTAEIRDALDQTDGGRHFILAPGCSVPDDTDEAHLRLARHAVDDLFH